MRRLPCLLACLLVATATRAAPADYQIDPVHTRVAFRVDHAGFSKAIGTFSGTTGRLRFDPDDWRSAELEVEIPLASLDIGEPGWRSKLLDATFFDSGRHPSARFVSTRVEPGDAGTARVFGNLSLRGRTREVVLDVRLNALKRHPLTLRRTAGFSATGTLRRSDFGMDAWSRLVGDEVDLWIEVEAKRARSENASLATPPEDTDADTQ